MIVPKFRRLLLFMFSSALECGGVFTRYLLSNLATNAVLQTQLLQRCRHCPGRQSAGWRVSNPGCILNVSPGQLTMSHPAPATMYTTGKKWLQ